MNNEIDSTEIDLSNKLLENYQLFIEICEIFS